MLFNYLMVISAAVFALVLAYGCWLKFHEHLHAHRHDHQQRSQHVAAVRKIRRHMRERSRPRGGPTRDIHASLMAWRMRG